MHEHWGNEPEPLVGLRALVDVSVVEGVGNAAEAT